MTTTIVIILPIHAIYHVLEAKAVTASCISTMQAFRMKLMGSLSLHICERGSLSFQLIPHC